MSDHYDPVECLDREVKRFKATNTFTPMEVTGFYLQAACVLYELEFARKEAARLKVLCDSLRGEVAKRERDFFKLEEDYVKLKEGR